MDENRCCPTTLRRRVQLRASKGTISIQSPLHPQRVWDNAMLTTNTKLVVYKACILSTLLYGSEAWTLYSHQERRLNAFHMRCLRRILGISWQDRVPNKDVLAQAGMTSMYALLSQRRLRWLGHVSRMDDGRIPKDVLYGELATGARPAGRPVLRYKDVLKRDMKAGGIDQTSWETVAADRSRWRQAVKTGHKPAHNLTFSPVSTAAKYAAPGSASTAIAGDA
ncbi:hypothetical protein Bbelb_399120 [Branchiostoma belcheri]|nr:hypothetical protein Bbelb_399120 [Branchiostoma belcheri]